MSLKTINESYRTLLASMTIIKKHMRQIMAKLLDDNATGRVNPVLIN